MSRELTLPGIGEALQRLRIQKGLSLTELANRVGWPKSRLSKYENNGLAVSLPVLDEIAKHLEVRPDVLVLYCLKQKYPRLGSSKVGRLLDAIVHELGEAS
jgi:transcriptional regulator with XRE-family HTH domain